MSWWVSLNNDKGEPLSVDSFREGGTYVLGGSTEADLNITYNYSKHYYRVLDGEQGLRWLDGKTGKDTYDRLSKAVDGLKDDWDDDYWEPTEGNAKRALIILMGWAFLHPEGIWRVS